jgi:Transposase IS66 family
MTKLTLSEKQRVRIEPLLQSAPMSRTEIDKQLDILFPDPKKHRTQRRIILEASALVGYRQNDDVIKILVCDDAPQFKNITDYLSLCWVHEGRHFKKLKPFITANREKVDRVITDLWAYYRKLLTYKQAPCKAQAERLSTEFDTLFSQTTGYDSLDDRLQKIHAKKDNLLLVLRYPDIPLHNNAAELGARVQTRRGDVSLQTKNDKGTKAKDTMMSIVQTARKLGVNTLAYIRDRVSLHFEMPSLSSLIILRSKEQFDSS